MLWSRLLFSFSWELHILLGCEELHSTKLSFVHGVTYEAVRASTGKVCFAKCEALPGEWC